MGFGRQLHEAYESRDGFPKQMRQKAFVDPKFTDKDIFEQLPLGDTWLDAKMHLVWKCIYESRHADIPASWQNVM